MPGSPTTVSGSSVAALTSSSHALLAMVQHSSVHQPLFPSHSPVRVSIFNSRPEGGGAELDWCVLF